MKLSQEYIKLILEAEYNQPSAEIQEITALFERIVAKFSRHLAFASHDYLPFMPRDSSSIAIKEDKYDEFWERFEDEGNSDFQELVFASTIYQKNDMLPYFEMFNIKALREYLRDDFKEFDVLVYFNNDDSHGNAFNNVFFAISKEKLEQLRHIAEKYEQFEVMVKRVAKQIS